MTVGVAEADTRELVQDLRRRVAGEVRFDKMSRVLYSTDASMYQIEPIGVVLPRSEEDVVAVVETANDHGVPVLPRGGGTSLAGQAVGRAVVIDFSKHMRNLLDVNVEEGWARTQPGIVLDELNLLLRPKGVQFAPDPSTSNRGNVGGAIGNNSCGAHSIVYGKTVDNVRELRVVLSNGDLATLGPAHGGALEAKTRGDSLEARVYRRLVEIGDACRDEVSARFPKIQRRVSGYNLDELASPDAIDTARFVVGSEGTLLTVTEAKVKVVPIPKAKVLAVLHFRELIESMEATVLALELGPASVELVDDMIIRQARENLEYSRMADFIDGDPKAILLVEFAGDSAAELEARLDDLDERMGRSGLSYSNRRFVDAADQARVWAVRKAGLGLMMNVRGPAKPLPFVEDTAVPPEALPEYVRRFDEIVREHGTSAGYYGHASVGCLHIRPLIDLTAAEDIERMVSIAAHVSDLVLEYGGAMSGEHGDGLARSAWNEKMFGSRIYGAFQEVKRAFDPEGVMNPGKIVDAQSMAENLRTTPSTPRVQVETGLDFAPEGGLGGAAQMCNGQAACRKLSGTMCPSYMVTRDEEHSTRGRANALRAAMTGALPVDSLTGDRLYRVMDLCLGCKGCKAECPSNVDVAKLKYEFLDRYHRANGYPLRNRIFANISTLSRLGSFFAPLSNWSLGSPAFKAMLEQVAGIDGRRDLPPFASQTFRQWFRARSADASADAPLGPVVLFADTFTDYNHPGAGPRGRRRARAPGLQGRRSGVAVLREAHAIQRDDRQGARQRPVQRRRRPPAGRAGREGRRPGAELHPQLPRRLPRPSARGPPGAGGRRRHDARRGARTTRRRPGRGAGACQRAREATVPWPLPPEGTRGRRAGHGRAAGRVERRRGGDTGRLLRHGRIVRLREGALRDLAQDRRAGPLRTDQIDRGRLSGRERGRLLPSAGSRRHRRSSKAPGRDTGRRNRPPKLGRRGESPHGRR